MDQRITEILAQGWNGVEIVVTPLIGGIPIFEFSLIVLFVIGAIYWFGFNVATSLQMVRLASIQWQINLEWLQEEQGVCLLQRSSGHGR